MWDVLDEGERALWDYVPSVGVGPLRFGMAHDEAAAAMAAEGFVCGPLLSAARHGALTGRADFRTVAGPGWATAVTVHYRRSGPLTCVAVDALRGPQVSLGGLRLVGRAPSEVTAGVWAYAAERGLPTALSVEGDAASDELGLLIRAQRAGDDLLSRAFFAKCGDWAATVHDCVPAAEWDVR